MGVLKLVVLIQYELGPCVARLTIGDARVNEPQFSWAMARVNQLVSVAVLLIRKDSVYVELPWTPKVGLAMKNCPVLATLVTCKSFEAPSGLFAVLTPEFIHALGNELMTLHPFTPDEKSPLGMIFDGRGMTVTVLVVVAVAVTVVVVVETPSASSVTTVCHATAVMLGVVVEVEVCSN